MKSWTIRSSCSVVNIWLSVCLKEKFPWDFCVVDFLKTCFHASVWWARLIRDLLMQGCESLAPHGRTSDLAPVLHSILDTWYGIALNTWGKILLVLHYYPSHLGRFQCLLVTGAAAACQWSHLDCLRHLKFQTLGLFHLEKGKLGKRKTVQP